MLAAKSSARWSPCNCWHHHSMRANQLLHDVLWHISALIWIIWIDGDAKRKERIVRSKGLADLRLRLQLQPVGVHKFKRRFRPADLTSSRSCQLISSFVHHAIVLTIQPSESQSSSMQSILKLTIMVPEDLSSGLSVPTTSAQPYMTVQRKSWNAGLCTSWCALDLILPALGYIGASSWTSRSIHHMREGGSS